MSANQRLLMYNLFDCFPNIYFFKLNVYCIQIKKLLKLRSRLNCLLQWLKIYIFNVAVKCEVFVCFENIHIFTFLQFLQFGMCVKIFEKKHRIIQRWLS